MNTDASSMYYFADVTLNDGNSNTWTCLSKEALLQRNKKSYWNDNKHVEEVCKGVRVKFACDGCAASYLFLL